MYLLWIDLNSVVNPMGTGVLALSFVIKFTIGNILNSERNKEGTAIVVQFFVLNSEKRARNGVLHYYRFRRKRRSSASLHVIWDLSLEWKVDFATKISAGWQIAPNIQNQHLRAPISVLFVFFRPSLGHPLEKWNFEVDVRIIEREIKIWFDMRNDFLKHPLFL